MTGITHRTIAANGIQMHVAEQGAGPLVVLCHGFPESWYSWRHQIGVLAAAGFHVVAPDMRGYGQTESPEAIDQFTLFHLVGDIIGLLDALGAETAVIAGHDWGAPVAWHAALMRPDRFRGVIGLSVPFRPRGPVRPSSVMPQTTDAIFYELYFQPPGVAEADLEHDVRASIRSVLLSIAGEAPARPDSSPVADNFSMIPRDGGLRGRITRDASEAVPLPGWVTEADIDFYAGEFSRAGFRGGLNWYRNIDRNWELLAPFAGARVSVPALYVAGDRDLVVAFRGMDQLIPNLTRFAPALRKTIMLPGCGHWTQQERPAEVSAAMIEFLRGLPLHSNVD
jgi:pimeloyl-ACP methyl ester carboxylesterase